MLTSFQLKILKIGNVIVAQAIATFPSKFLDLN